MDVAFAATVAAIPGAERLPRVGLLLAEGITLASHPNKGYEKKVCVPTERKKETRAPKEGRDGRTERDLEREIFSNIEIYVEDGTPPPRRDVNCVNASGGIFIDRARHKGWLRPLSARKVPASHTRYN